MAHLVWLVVITTVLALGTAGVLIWAAASVQRERIHATIEWGRRLLVAQEEERAAIARELHDSVVPDLDSLEMQLVNNSTTAGEATRIAQRVRSISRLLHPGVLDHLDLNAAVQQLVGTDAAWPFAVDIDIPTLPTMTKQQRLAAFRIIQEALANVRRHAGAESVVVSAFTQGDDVVVTIHDDGAGFVVPPAERLSSLGLRSMRERAEALGGTLLIESTGPGGTTIRATFPTPAA